jgi:cold shock CspA family protein
VIDAGRFPTGGGPLFFKGEFAMEATVKFWNAEKNFGFAVTDAGKEFYLSIGRFNRLAARGGQLPADLEGRRIRFDRATKSHDASWMKSLNEGKLRDAAGVDARNPRPPRRPQERPVATNVVVIEEKS